MRSIKGWIRKPIAALAAVATISGALVAAPVAQAGSSVPWFSDRGMVKGSESGVSKYATSIPLYPDGGSKATVKFLTSGMDYGFKNDLVSYNTAFEASIVDGVDRYNPAGVGVKVAITNPSIPDPSYMYPYAVCYSDPFDDGDNGNSRLINDLRQVATSRKNGPVSNFDIQPLQVGVDGSATAVLRVPTGLLAEQRTGYAQKIYCSAFKSQVALSKSDLERVNVDFSLATTTYDVGKLPNYPAGKILTVTGPLSDDSGLHVDVEVNEARSDIYVAVASGAVSPLSNYSSDQGSDTKYKIPVGAGQSIYFYIAEQSDGPYVLLDRVDLVDNVPSFNPPKYVYNSKWSDDPTVESWLISESNRTDYIQCKDKNGEDVSDISGTNVQGLAGVTFSRQPIVCRYGNADVPTAPVHYSNPKTVSLRADLFSDLKTELPGTATKDSSVIDISLDVNTFGAYVGTPADAAAKYKLTVTDGGDFEKVLSLNDFIGTNNYSVNLTDEEIAKDLGTAFRALKSPLTINLSLADGTVLESKTLDVPQEVTGKIDLGTVKWVNDERTANLEKPRVTLKTRSGSNISTAKLVVSAGEPSSDELDGVQEVSFTNGFAAFDMNPDLADAISSGTKIWVKPSVNSLSPGEWTELTGFLKKPTATITSQGSDAIVSGTDALRCSIDGADWSYVTSSNRVLTGAAGKSVICQKFNDPIESPAITTSVTAALPTISSVAIERIGGKVTITPTASAELSSGQHFFYGGEEGESSHIIVSDEASTLEIKVQDASGNAGKAVTVDIPAKLADPVLSKVTYPLTTDVTLAGTGDAGSKVVVAKGTVTPAATAPEGAQTSAAIVLLGLFLLIGVLCLLVRL